MGLLGDKFNQVYQDPMAQIGLGLLSSNNGRQGSMGRGLAQGMQNANTVQQQMMQAAQQKQMQEQLMQQRAAQMQAAQRKQQQMAQQRQAVAQAYPNNPMAQAYPSKAAEAMFRAPPKPTPFDQKKALLQNDPETYYKMNPPRTPLVNIGDKLRTVEDQIKYDTRVSRSKEATTSNKKWLAAGAQARPDIRRYEKILSLLDTTETGTFAESRVKLLKLAQGLGMDIDASSAGTSEELMVLMGDEVMGRIAQTKGAVSEREMRLFETFSASFGKTTEGNKRIIQYKLAQSKRNEDVANLVRSARRQGKGATDIDNLIFEYVNNPGNDLSKYLQVQAAEPVVQSAEDIQNAAAAYLREAE